MTQRKFQFVVVRDWSKDHIIQVRRRLNSRGQMMVWGLTPAELLALYHTIGDYLVANRKDLFPDDKAAGSKGIDRDPESLAKDGGMDIQSPR